MLKIPLSQLTFTVVDTETTGYSPKSAKLVEIGAIRVNSDLTIDADNMFSQLVNPECHIGYDTYKIHGISNAMVADMPNISTVIPKFVDFSKNTVIVAHNARFDMGFINAAMDEHGVEQAHIAVLDTVRLARKAFPGYKSYSLDMMINHLNLTANIEDSYRHRALFDAAHTAQLLIKCIKILTDKGAVNLCDL